jgi:hypothetical protein
MKFQSLIAAIMHGIHLTARASLIGMAFIPLNSCVSLIAKKNTYSSSPSVRVNDAEIRMQVKPQGTANGSFVVSAMVVSAAVATLDGPFSWRLEAIGKSGEHNSLIIHRIRTRTSLSKRDEWYPASRLGKRYDFLPAKGGSHTSRAIYPIPGLLKVMPKVDGALDVSVDLSIVAGRKSERKIVRFRMDPSQTRQNEFIFIPTEIVKSFGQSPAEWGDQGWD